MDILTNKHPCNYVALNHMFVQAGQEGDDLEEPEGRPVVSNIAHDYYDDIDDNYPAKHRGTLM